MAKRVGKAARLTISALAMALLVSGCAMEDAASEGGSELRETVHQMGEELDRSESVGLPSAAVVDDRTVPIDGEPVTEDRYGYAVDPDSIALSPEGGYYLSDQILLSTEEGSSPEIVLSELTSSEGSLVVGRNEAIREYQVLLPTRYPQPELQELADRWELHPAVRSAELSELSQLPSGI